MGPKFATLRSAIIVGVFLAAPAHALTTKSYVVSWFHMATTAYDGACPEGMNPQHVELWSRSLRELGYADADIQRLLTGGKINGRVLQDIVRDRGRIKGKENTFAYPWSAPDPHIKTVNGRYAIGFNLDGRGADAPNAFEDPETHERGVDNELFRAYGCFYPYQISLPERPQYESGAWFQLTGAMPAWVLSISGENFQNGPVTVVLARALEKSILDARGTIMADATYRIDPNPRSINVFRGEIRNGVISIVPADLMLEAEPHWLTKLLLRKAQLRLTTSADGGIAGFIGGYTPWHDQFFILSSNGYDAEETGMDLPGLWYALDRLADGPKDPKTGKSDLISSAFRIEAVPAIVVDPTGAVAKALPRQLSDASAP